MMHLHSPSFFGCLKASLNDMVATSLTRVPCCTALRQKCIQALSEAGILDGVAGVVVKGKLAFVPSLFRPRVAVIVLRIAEPNCLAFDFSNGLGNDFTTRMVAQVRAALSASPAGTPGDDGIAGYE